MVSGGVELDGEALLFHSVLRVFIVTDYHVLLNEVEDDSPGFAAILGERITQNGTHRMFDALAYHAKHGLVATTSHAMTTELMELVNELMVISTEVLDSIVDHGHCERKGSVHWIEYPCPR